MMTNIENFHIVLAKEPAIYLPGEKVSGSLNVKVINRLKVKGIKVELFGAARIHW
jgi:hypothetical protein